MCRLIKYFAISVALVAASASATATRAADNAEDPTNIVADQIRDQGYKCDHPQRATRDASASRPDEAVWLLTCEDASYRVRLVPDMAAKVEQLKQDKSQDEQPPSGAEQSPPQ